MDPRNLAFLSLIVIVGGVFTIGTQTTWLGPYSDNLHLVMLSSVLFFTLLIYLIYRRRSFE